MYLYHRSKNPVENNPTSNYPSKEPKHAYVESSRALLAMLHCDKLDVDNEDLVGKIIGIPRSSNDLHHLILLGGEVRNLNDVVDTVRPLGARVAH